MTQFAAKIHRIAGGLVIALSALATAPASAEPASLAAAVMEPQLGAGDADAEASRSQPRQADDRRGQGLRASLATGVSWLSMRRSSDDLTQGIAASGGSLDLTVGYAARPGWFVIAELFVGMGSPRYSRDGASQPGDTGALLAHGYAGLGLAHDLSWQQLTVQATAGPSRMIYVSPQAVGWTKTGAMVSAAASRDVHLGQRWSVGAALLGQLGVIPDLAGPTWTSAQLSLMVQVSVD